MCLHRTTVVPGLDGLRRPLPLSRALREPLPPRPAGEVQGLGARARLVARASGRADARLPARLQRAAEDPDLGLRAILALPSLRVAGVGLLRHLAAVLVSEPAREPEPDSEGALPAPARSALDGGDPARRLCGDGRDRDRAQPRLSARLARDGLALAACRRADRRLRCGSLACRGV